jgi:cyclophilin family peptidyl-prolyl cis-trans isomerase
MKTFKKLLLFLLLPLFVSTCNSNKDNNNTFVLIKTTLGDIKVRLYNETPLHRDNFIKLVKLHFYDGVSFHRVIKGFMVQSGDGLTKLSKETNDNDTLNTYTIPAELNRHLFHKKGALAAAREGNDVNPEMRSSGTQFYIVEGVQYTDEELDKAEQRINNNLRQARFMMLIKQISDSNRISGLNMKESEIQEKASLRFFQMMSDSGTYKLPEDRRNIYKSVGGTPFLDCTYTVFGEVTEGLDIVDRIALVATDSADKPLTAIRILSTDLLNK